MRQQAKIGQRKNNKRKIILKPQQSGRNMLNNDLAELGARSAGLYNPQMRIQYQRVVTKAPIYDIMEVREGVSKRKKRQKSYNGTIGGVSQYAGTGTHRRTDGMVDLGQPSIISYEANSGDNQKHLRNKGTTSIMHKIPTANFRSQSKHGGTTEQMMLMSLDSQGEPIAISPRFTNAQRMQGANPQQQHPTSSDQMIDLGLRDSRLTNIVLDDFRQQVKGLEMQVGNSPMAKSPLESRKAIESSLFNKYSPTTRKNHESTDLEEQHHSIQQPLQPKGGGAGVTTTTTAGAVFQIGVKNSIIVNNKGQRQVEDVEAGAEAEKTNQEEVITTHQIQEMRRRLQRRQRGIKSQEDSYLTMLDPNQRLDHSSEQHPQQHQMIITQNNPAKGRYLHSMGGSHPVATIGLPQQQKGHNQFMKSFVQNQKNSSMFTQFMARASGKNQHEVARTTAKRRATQQNNEVSVMAAVAPKVITFSQMDPSDKNVKESMVMVQSSQQNAKIKIQQGEQQPRRSSGDDFVDQQIATKQRTQSLTEMSNDVMGHLQNKYGTMRLDKNTTAAEMFQMNDKNAQTSFIMQESSKLDTDSYIGDKTPSMRQKRSSRLSNVFKAASAEVVVTGRQESQTMGTAGEQASPTTQIALNIQNLNSQEPTLNSTIPTSPHFAISDNHPETILNSTQMQREARPNNRITVPINGTSNQSDEPYQQRQHPYAGHSSPNQTTLQKLKTLERSPVRSPPKRKTLASLVSVTSLSRINEDQSAIKMQQHAPVNVQIRLMTGGAQKSEEKPTCSCEKVAASGIDGQSLSHSVECELGPSQSQLVLQQVNSKFVKADAMSLLAKKNEKRNNKLLYPDHPHLRQQNGSHLRFQDSNRVPQCECLGKPCCTVLKSKTKMVLATVPECNCVQHSYKYQIATRHDYTKFAAVDPQSQQMDDHPMNPKNTQPGTVTEVGGTGALSQKRIIHSRHRTVDKWTSRYGINSQSVGNRGNMTAVHSSRKDRINLTQALSSNQGSGGRFPMRESRIQEGKLPSIVHDTTFASEHQIAGARITFIEQLKSSYDGQKGGNIDREKETQSSLYRRFVGSQESMPRTFKDVIQEARNSSYHIEQRQRKGAADQDETDRYQSIFSVNVAGKEIDSMMSSKFDTGTSRLLADQKHQLTTETDGEDGGFQTLSVKKQLRLQKMALQGMNYRPDRNEPKIFTKGDIREYFKNSMEQHEVVKSTENARVMFSSQMQDSLADPLSQSLEEDDPQQIMMLSSHMSNKKENKKAASNSRVLLDNANEPATGQDDYQQATASFTSSMIREGMINTGSVTFGTVANINNDSIAEEAIASPISSYMHGADFKNSKEIDDWIVQEEQKKLMMSKQAIKKLTADPVMSIEQTKARNNKAMLKKIQKKVEQMQARKAQKAHSRAKMQRNFDSKQTRNSVDRTLFEESYFSVNSTLHDISLQQPQNYQSQGSNHRRYNSKAAALYSKRESSQKRATDYASAGSQNTRQHFTSTTTNQSHDMSLWHQQKNSLNRTMKNKVVFGSIGHEQMAANSRTAGVMGTSQLFQPTKAKTVPRQSPYTTIHSGQQINDHSVNAAGAHGAMIQTRLQQPQISIITQKQRASKNKKQSALAVIQGSGIPQQSLFAGAPPQGQNMGVADRKKQTIEYEVHVDTLAFLQNHNSATESHGQSVGSQRRSFEDYQQYHETIKEIESPFATVAAPPAQQQ